MKKTTKLKLFALAGFVLISGLVFSCKKDPELPQEEPGDNPITFTVNIPANTVSVNIDRREVTKKGDTYESIEPDDGGWFTIATRYIGQDDEEYSQAKEKSFTDVYGVENGKYYEYRLMKNDGQGEEQFESLGYYKAGYDGAQFPDFHANQYPVIEWDPTAKKLSLTNADKIAFNCKNGEEVLGWVIDVSYDSKDWHWSTFFGKEDHTFEIMENDKHAALKKGNNPISCFSVKINISEQDYFSYQRFYDISEIDAKKVATSIPGIIDAPTTSVGININVTTPPVPIAQTHIYRKLSTEPDNKFQEVGFHDGWYEEMIFTDYYYESGKTYDYVAKFTYEDYATYAVMDLGSVTTTTTGLTLPKFKEGKTPVFEWDAKNLELKIKNKPELEIPENPETYWGQEYCWSVVFTYNFPESGFWPQFLFDKDNNPIDISAEEDAPPNPNIVADWAIEGMSDKPKDNMMQECVIHIIEEGKFEQCIVLYQMPLCNIFANQDQSGVYGTRPDWTIEYLSKE